MAGGQGAQAGEESAGLGFPVEEDGSGERFQEDPADEVGRAAGEGLRQEAGPSVRVTTVSPGPIATEFAEASSNSRVRAEITRMRDEIAIPPDAVARAIAFAVEQPATVDVSEIVVRPTAQS